MHSKYTIAGLNVLILECHDEKFFSRRYHDYQSDFKDEDAHMILRSRVVNDMEFPEGELIIDTPANKLYKLANSNYVRVRIRPSDNYIVEKFTYTPDWKDCLIELSELPRCQLSLQDREYMFTFDAFVSRVCYLGGVMLHSSCISYDGQAVLFSANSGTGKSTHTSLWKKVFKDKVEYINDDKPILWFEDGKAYACGTPWSGKTDLNTNVKCPIAGIVFLERGEKNEIEEVSVKEILMTLFSNIIIPVEAKELARQVLDVYTKIVTHTKIYRLKCNMDDEAALVSKNKILGGL